MFYQMKTGDLFAMRKGIIWWVTAMCAPWETVFDAIEDELESRGHRVKLKLVEPDAENL